MTARSTIGAAAALAVAVSFLPAAAADDDLGPTGFEIGAFAGAVVLDEDLTGGDRSAEPLVGARLAGRLGERWRWFGDLAWSSTSTETFAGDADLLAGRAGVEWIADPLMRWQPFYSAAYGWSHITFDAATDFDSGFVSVGLGTQRATGARGAVRWELRVEQTLAPDGLRGEDLTQIEAVFGYQWRLGRGGSTPVDHDPDSDGVLGSRDRCPDTPAGAVVDVQGCPVDSDRDGVADGIDRCPGSPTGGPVDASGCPPDADGDGVPDERDRCPDTVAGDPVDDSGCVVDADGDGVPDVRDRCPNTLGGIEVDPDGCFLDRDGDGVYDGLGMDACPDTPPGTPVDRFGCPLEGGGSR